MTDVPHKQVIAYDIELKDGVDSPSGGVAYYRLPDDMYEFLKLCAEKHGIIGFEWDGVGRNFGIICGDKEDQSV